MLMVSSLLGSLRPILLKEYMRMLYTEAGCKSTMFAWLMVGEMLRVDCLKSQESGKAACEGGQRSWQGATGNGSAVSQAQLTLLPPAVMNLCPKTCLPAPAWSPLPPSLRDSGGSRCSEGCKPS